MLPNNHIPVDNNDDLAEVDTAQPSDPRHSARSALNPICFGDKVYIIKEV